MSVLIRCFRAEQFLAQLLRWDPRGFEQCWAMLQITPGREASPRPNSDPGPVAASDSALHPRGAEMIGQRQHFISLSLFPYLTAPCSTGNYRKGNAKRFMIHVCLFGERILCCFAELRDLL